MKLGLIFVLFLSLTVKAASPLDLQWPESLEDKIFVKSLYNISMTFPFGCTNNDEFKKIIEGRELSNFPTSSYRFNKKPDWIPRFEYETGNFNSYSPVLSLIESCCLDNIKSLAEAGINLKEPYLANPERSDETHIKFYSKKSITNKNDSTTIHVEYYIPKDPSLKGEGKLTYVFPDESSHSINFQLEGKSPIESLHQLLDGKAIPVLEIVNKQDPTLITALDYTRAFKNDPNWKNRDNSCFSKVENYLISNGVLAGDELIKNPEYKDIYKGAEKKTSMLLSLTGSIPHIKKDTSKHSIANDSDRNLVKESKDPSAGKELNVNKAQTAPQ